VAKSRRTRRQITIAPSMSRQHGRYPATCRSELRFSLEVNFHRAVPSSFMRPQAQATLAVPWLISRLHFAPVFFWASAGVCAQWRCRTAAVQDVLASVCQQNSARQSAPGNYRKRQRFRQVKGPFQDRLHLGSMFSSVQKHVFSITIWPVNSKYADLPCP